MAVTAKVVLPIPEAPVQATCGRYLAAAGRGRPEGASDLVVYQVDGFRRLPGFDWPEHEEHKEKVFHDLMFRPDEETLLVLWERVFCPITFT